MRIKGILLLMFMAASLLLGGCSLLNLPLQLAGAAVGVASEAVGLVQSLPLPPPWLFF
jgi:hypothetical protein